MWQWEALQLGGFYCVFTSKKLMADCLLTGMRAAECWSCAGHMTLHHVWRSWVHNK